MTSLSDGAARRSDPDTSKAAAQSVNTKTLGQLVVSALKEVGPMTTEELAAVLQETVVTISPRMRPLVNLGLVRDSGQTRANNSGRKAILWEAV